MNPHQIYQQQQTSNATRIEMLLGLYDKAIQNLTQAHQALKGRDLSAATPLVLQAQVMVYALANGVDLQYGEISQNMLRLYEFVLHRLGSSEAQNIREALHVLTILREGFREIEPKAKAMELSGKLPRPKSVPALQMSA